MSYDFYPDNPPADPPALSEYTYRQLFELMQQGRALSEEITQLQELIVELVPSAAGQAILATPIPFNVTTGWTTLQYDTISTTDTRGISFNLASDQIIFEKTGNWRTHIIVALQGFAELNSSRTIYLRSYNVTTGTPGNATVIGVGRNTADLNVSISTIFTIPVEGEIYRMEIGGGDALSGGNLITSTLGANFVGSVGSLA